MSHFWFVTLWCAECRMEASREDHPRGGTSWWCPRCQRAINPLDKRNHKPPEKGSPSPATLGSAEGGK